MKEESRWYFLRTAMLAVPWEQRNADNPRGLLLKNYFLINAVSLKSAKKKAERILSVRENLSGSANCGTRGKSETAYQVSLIKVGIINLEQLIENMESGVELFEDSEENISLDEAKARLINGDEFKQEVREEEEKGFLTMLPGMPFWGDDFDDL